MSSKILSWLPATYGLTRIKCNWHKASPSYCPRQMKSYTCTYSTLLITRHLTWMQINFYPYSERSYDGNWIHSTSSDAKVVLLHDGTYAAADAGFRRGGGGHACGRDPKYSQLGGMGERCELPHRGLGQSPRSQRFLHFKTFQNYVKIMII